MQINSIFELYYSNPDFCDRYLVDPGKSITVIVPVAHTNELWEANLKSIYREVPVAQLLIGDGGCIDDSIEIAKRFPRVVIYNHAEFKSLGFSIRKLIEAVQSEWFIYLHSDVYLPSGWFDSMYRYKEKYDWFGCRMQHTVMIEYDNDYGERPYWGSQMGRKSVFVEGLKSIDDDFVYRQEDFVFSDIVSKGGFREGKIDDVYHYHQTIKKSSPFWNPKDIKVNITQKISREEEFRIWDMQFRGVVKYLMPSSNWARKEAGVSAFKLTSLGVISDKELYHWVKSTNPIWLPIVKSALAKHRFRQGLSLVSNSIKLAIGKWI